MAPTYSPDPRIKFMHLIQCWHNWCENVKLSSQNAIILTMVVRIKKGAFWHKVGIDLLLWWEHQQASDILF